MILDAHIHLGAGEFNPRQLQSDLKAAGVDGGILISLPPASFKYLGEPSPAAERLAHLFAWTDALPNTFPFFWIDPLEPDAVEQVVRAVDRGVLGFKVICNQFYPEDPIPMGIFDEIARQRKPILFHSGILWDGATSSKYNRPVEFEVLGEIPGLKFALAHISWPWCDECLALFGKFAHSQKSNPDFSAEMFIDLTPGTPPIFRREALTKLFTIGYPVEENVLFGSDAVVPGYHSSGVKKGMQIDQEILSNLGLTETTVANLFGLNLQRFLGIES